MSAPSQPSSASSEAQSGFSLKDGSCWHPFWAQPAWAWQDLPSPSLPIPGGPEFLSARSRVTFQPPHLMWQPRGIIVAS